jgi:uncharacterized protein YciI
MPLFAIHALDKPDVLALRLEHYAAHRSYVETAEAGGVRVLISGPLQTDDGESMIGSLFIVEAEDRSAVSAFTGRDPFQIFGVWGQVVVTRFHKRKG